MDLNEFRSFILESGLDIWKWIDLSISVACADHEDELRRRRDGIIRRLYEPAFSRCRSCDNQLSRGYFEGVGGHERGEDCVGFECIKSENEEEDEEDDDDDHDCGRDEQKRILEIKTLLDDENQSERSLIDLLQRLVEMDTTFQILKDTDIGRHVSKLRKHSCNEVRRLVKFLVRKWKDTVDEWVKSNTPDDEATQLTDDKKKSSEETNHWGNGDEQKSLVCSYSTPPKEKMKNNEIESDKAAKRSLHDHAKKQRTDTRDFQNVQKLKNGALSNGGSSVPVKNW